MESNIGSCGTHNLSSLGTLFEVIGQQYVFLYQEDVIWNSHKQNDQNSILASYVTQEMTSYCIYCQQESSSVLHYCCKSM